MRRAAAASVVLLAALAAAPSAVGGDPAPDPAAEAKAAEDAAIAAATKDAERRMGTTLRVARRGPFVVRGDVEQPDLEHMAELALSTLDHYAGAMATEAGSVLRAPKRGESARVEIWQFRQEREYLAFVDRVFSRVRDDTVDDRRLALLRRQRGFFVTSPRPIIAQYQGPSEMATCDSQAVHKTSHVLLLTHRPAGSWMPWWYLEGFAAWQEMAVLRESRTYCLEVDRPGDYAKPGTPEADEAAKARLEAAWRRRAKELLATKKARDLAALAKLSLNELTLEDVIQSWSVVDWIVRERKLVAFTTAYKDDRDFAKACEAALGGPPASVEARWGAWLRDAK